MSTHAVTALAHPNIAFIKYWGNRDDALRLPANGSISMNLGDLETRTRVEFENSLKADELTLNGQTTGGEALDRTRVLLDEVRRMARIDSFARVVSSSNFPLGAGLASSASGFAALALAASQAAGLDLTEAALSRLARRGSGSACRSIPGGFVEWQAGSDDDDSYAASIAPPDHWNLVDCIAVVNAEPKAIGSSRGNSLAGTSPLQAARIQDAPRRLAICRKAILERDFQAFTEIVEQDSILMHAVMMTSLPPLFYWQPGTLRVLEAVQAARQAGLRACSTIDAGPNVHVLCESGSADETAHLLDALPEVREVLRSRAGGSARLVENSPLLQSTPAESHGTTGQAQNGYNQTAR